MKSIQQWLDEYGESHRNKTNKTIHWVCVPAIVFSLLALLWGVPLPGLADLGFANAATALVLLSGIYYFALSVPLALGMLVLAGAMLSVLYAVDTRIEMAMWQIGVAVFVVAWIGQFVGHKIEGKKPSFFKDVQFLLIGPLWLLAALYRRLGVRY